MTDRKPHLIYLELSDEHVGIRVQCPGPKVGGCGIWEECNCKCEIADCPCRNDEHDECIDTSYAEMVNPFWPSCSTETNYEECGLVEPHLPFDEMIRGDNWPTDEYPIKAEADWGEWETWTLKPWQESA